MAKVIEMKKKTLPTKLVPPEYTKIEQLIDIEMYYIRGLADIELKYNTPNMDLMEAYCDSTCRLDDLKRKILEIFTN